MFYALSKLGFMLIRPSNAFILLIFAGLLLRGLNHVRRGNQFVVIALLLMAASAWSCLPSLLMYPLEQRFSAPAHPESLNPTGIIVLGGIIDTHLSTERGAPEFVDGAERLIEAAALARRYPAARVIFTGGSATFVDSTDTPEAEFARQVLIDFGIAPERITLEKRSRNTRENAAFTLDVVQPQATDSWILVTSAFHMPRAMGTFRAAGWNGLTAWPVDYRVEPHPRLLEAQFASDGLFLTDLAIKEWIGLTAYRFAGYTDALFPAPG
ncbi:YdcF family protein [Oryzibacter oryziterrae]|uniref:YdcF family protein n=1 Tax=Oryzibacter oryziterrae TaxID=2766474 RepID=UPI001F1C4E0C|nr:YdcF family protein [Oryzibacter oryziterrae]